MFLSWHLKAQQVVLRGQILESETAIPLSDVLVRVGEKKTISSRNGEFIFPNLPKGKIQLTIQHQTFIPYSKEIDLQQDTSIIISLSSQPHQIEEVRIARNLSHRINTVRKESRQEAEGKNLGEMLSDIAGINTLKTGNNIVKPIINGHYGNRILILTQGIRHESQQWGLDHAPEIDPFAYERIQVIKHADALRYGADALGGLILLENPLSDENQGSSLSVNSGLNTNGREGYLHTLIRRKSGAFSVQGGLTAARSGNIRSAKYYLGNTGKADLHANMLSQYHKEKHQIAVLLTQFKTQTGIFQGAHIGNIDDIQQRIKLGRPIEQYHFSYTIGAPKQEIQHLLGKISYRYKWNSHTVLESNYSIQKNHRKEFDLRRVQSEETPMADMVLTSQQLEIVLKRGTSLLGIHGMLQVNNNTPGTGTTPFIPNFDNHSFAAFANHLFSFGKEEVQLGLRYDFKYFDAAGYRYDYDRRNDDGTIPQVLLKDRKTFNNLSGVVNSRYSITPFLSWNSTLSFAWRAPSANELYSEGLHHGTATYEIGDLNLRSEKATKWINGIHYNSNRFNLNAEMYGQLIKDYIYNKPSPKEFRQTIRGTFPIFRYSQADALFYGVDIDASLRLAQRWDYQLQYSFVHAKNLQDNSFFPNIPGDRLQQSLVFRINKHNENAHYLKLKHQFQRTQTRFEEGSDFDVPPPSYHLFDLIYSKSFALKEKHNLLFSIAAENLFNTEYKNYLDRLRYYAHSKGRNIAIKFNYSL